MVTDNPLNNNQISPKSIIFFDGACNLCNGAVNFVIEEDKGEQFLFASLQSKKALELLQNFSFNPQSNESIALLTSRNTLYTKSDAVLEIAKQLGGMWTFFYVFRFVPLKIRNKIYDLVAALRYKIFGKRDQCKIFTQELAYRFLDAY